MIVPPAEADRFDSDDTTETISPEEQGALIISGKIVGNAVPGIAIKDPYGSIVGIG